MKRQSESLLACPFCKAPIIALSAVNDLMLNYSGNLRGWCSACKRPIIQYESTLFIGMEKPENKGASSD